MAKKPQPNPTVADNRRARFDFAIEDSFEAGILLQGTEVKALRAGKAMIAESYASAKDGELWLINAHIPEYTHANRFNHEERRPRKLLMRRREIDKLARAVDREGMTLVPLRLFFTDRGIAKLQLGLAKGKKLHDKRETSQERDWARDKARLMKQRGRE